MTTTLERRPGLGVDRRSLLRAYALRLMARRADNDRRLPPEAALARNQYVSQCKAAACALEGQGLGDLGSAADPDSIRYRLSLWLSVYANLMTRNIDLSLWHGVHAEYTEARDLVHTNYAWHVLPHVDAEVGGGRNNDRVLPGYVLDYRDGLLERLAASAREERDEYGFLCADNLLILADAAEEAGADDELCVHLRDDAVPHALGCWAVEACFAG
jgi:hypothetical protein